MAPLQVPEVDLGHSTRRVPAQKREKHVVGNTRRSFAESWKVLQRLLSLRLIRTSLKCFLRVLAPSMDRPRSLHGRSRQARLSKKRVSRWSLLYQSTWRTPKSRGLEASTLSKLDTLFRKQFFSWGFK